MVRTIREVLRLADLRRVVVGWGLSLTGELSATVTLVAYSYGAGGAALVAAYTVARTVAAMCVALSLAALAGRFRREKMLRWFTAARAALLALAALAAALHGPAAAVIALAAASSSLQGTYRPTMSMLLPWLVRTPAHLASANVMAAVLENLAGLAGPLLAGALLAFAPAWVPIACAALFLGMAAWSLRHLMIPARPSQDGRGVRQAVRDVVTGVAEFAKVAAPAGVMILIFAQMFLRGALTVLIAELAVKTLMLGPSAVGWLNAAIGAGGVVGGALAATVVRVTRLGRSFIGGLLLCGLPLALLAIAPTAALAYLAFAVVGLGNAVESVGVFTLVPRLVSHQVGGKVGGAKEFTSEAGVAAGALCAPWLLHGLGMRGTLALLGGGLAVLALAHARRFARVDHAMPPPGEEVQLLRRLPLFSSVPLAVIELLATELAPRQFAPGEVVFREGAPGSEFHLITSGSAEVSVHGDRRPPLARGDCFGEIALLRGVPRTATIAAGEPLRTLALDRETFLFAITGNGDSSAAAAELVSQRLARDTAGPQAD